MWLLNHGMEWAAEASLGIQKEPGFCGRILNTATNKHLAVHLTDTILQVTDDSQEFLRLRKIWSMAGSVDWDCLAHENHDRNWLVIFANYQEIRPHHFIATNDRKGNHPPKHQTFFISGCFCKRSAQFQQISTYF